jgi:hypothetical protein
MKVVLWVAALSIGSWLAVAVLADRATAVAAFWGMVAPLLVTAASWTAAERTYRSNPRGLTAVMLAGFGGKLLFFGVYVAVMLRVLMVRPVPFAASFTSYFVALHLIEALCLRRLFAAGHIDS